MRKKMHERVRRLLAGETLEAGETRRTLDWVEFESGDTFGAHPEVYRKVLGQPLDDHRLAEVVAVMRECVMVPLETVVTALEHPGAGPRTRAMVVMVYGQELEAHGTLDAHEIRVRGVWDKLLVDVEGVEWMLRALEGVPDDVLEAFTVLARDRLTTRGEVQILGECLELAERV